MIENNVISKDNKTEIEDLKNKLYTSKRKRLELIDGYIDKIKNELDKRDLKDIPTPVLSRMLISFADLAKKEQPIIELVHKEKDDSDISDYMTTYKTEKVIL